MCVCAFCLQDPQSKQCITHAYPSRRYKYKLIADREFLNLDETKICVDLLAKITCVCVCLSHDVNKRGKNKDPK